MEGLLLILIGLFGGLFVREDGFVLKCAVGLSIVLILVSSGK